MREFKLHTPLFSLRDCFNALFILLYDFFQVRKIFDLLAVERAQNTAIVSFMVPNIYGMREDLATKFKGHEHKNVQTSCLDIETSSKFVVDNVNKS